MHRLERGVVYGREKAELAMRNFFRESTLVALRELALRETAHEVEHRTIAETAPAARHAAGVAAAIRERQKILVLITADPTTAMAIRRAKRISDFLGAECFAVAVQGSGEAGAMPEAEREAMERQYLRQLRPQPAHRDPRSGRRSDGSGVDRFRAPEPDYADLCGAPKPAPLAASAARPR